MDEKIKLTGVPETMLQTVYARAKESRGRGAIHDAKAEEIIGALDYDFSRADKDAPMHSGVIARTIVLDKLTSAWLAALPGAALVKLLPGFHFREEHSLTEGMAQFVPVYKLLDKLPAIRNISNKIVVLEKG